MVLGEQYDGSVIEIESQDVDFIEDEFLSRGEVKKDPSSMKQWISKKVL